MTYKELQLAQWAWASARFGDERSALKALEPFAGVVEELGELAEAELKGNASLVEDSIGDAVIYLCDVCNRMFWEMPGIPAVRSHVSLRIELGRLGHSILKSAQGIRHNEDHAQVGQECVWQLLVHLDGVASKWHLGTALDCAEVAWQEVSQRSAGHAAIPKEVTDAA